MSKTQIDRLGERLKKGNISEADLRLLDEYRRSFAEAFDFLAGLIRKKLNVRVYREAREIDPVYHREIAEREYSLNSDSRYRWLSIDRA